jgi:two-component system capsular synthesis sensor histidine kinase RcsC
VLVVDDSEGNRRLLRRMLEQLGCTVFEATDGDEVQAALGAMETEGRDVDVVLMDIEMVRVSGSVAMTQARSGGWVFPAIAVTGHAESSSIDTCGWARGMFPVGTCPP